MGRIKSTTLRFNLSKPEQQTAWEYLQNLEKEKYKSINHAITLAVCDFFERQKHAESDPFSRAANVRKCSSGVSLRRWNRLWKRACPHF